MVFQRWVITRFNQSHGHFSLKFDLLLDREGWSAVPGEGGGGGGRRVLAYNYLLYRYNGAPIFLAVLVCDRVNRVVLCALVWNLEETRSNNNNEALCKRVGWPNTVSDRDKASPGDAGLESFIDDNAAARIKWNANFLNQKHINVQINLQWNVGRKKVERNRRKRQTT